MKPAIDRILFPTDFSRCAEGAYRHAAFLADHFGSEVHILHVVEDDEAPERDWPDEPGTGSLAITLADVCDDLGLPAPEPEADYDLLELVPVVESEVVGRDPADAILDYAHDEEVGLVVIGTHGRRGWQRGLLGSVAEAVVRRVPCPVLTVRPLDAPGQGDWPPRRVLLAVDAVPYDGFAEGDVPVAARWAAQFARAYRAPLEIVHVVSPGVLALGGPDESARVRDRARDALKALARCLRAETDDALQVSIAVRTGDPADAIRAEAEEAATHLLVVGTHGRRGAGRALLGSVAETLVRTAPCPVLVARDRLARPVSQDARAAREVSS